MTLEILAYEPTELGTLCLRRRQLLSQPDVTVTEVTLNHEFLMSSYLTESERKLTATGLRLVNQANPDSGLRVLVGGLGLGYSAAEALKSAEVEHVEVVEFLPQVIGWARDGLIPLSEELKDPRIKITNGDIYARVTSPIEEAGLFDLIAIDVDHSPEDVLGSQSHEFYSVEGLTKVRQHLRTNGILGVWSYAASSPLLENMKQVFSDVQTEEVTVFNDLINVEQTDWLFFGRNEG